MLGTEGSKVKSIALAGHAPGGLIYHVLDRAAGRGELFSDEGHYAAFIRVLVRTVDATSMRVCAFCLMPNHCDLVLWPGRSARWPPYRGESWTDTTEAPLKLRPLRKRGRPTRCVDVIGRDEKLTPHLHDLPQSPPQRAQFLDSGGRMPGSASACHMEPRAPVL